jgi:hypothetical protein
VGVVDAQNNLTVGNAQITFKTGIISTTFTVTVPLSLLGGDDGYVNAAAIMFNTIGPTDSVPNGGYLGMYSNIIYLPLIFR